LRTVEPEQTGERRLRIEKEGTAAYLKVAYHAPAVSDPQFVPALLLDAILTGAKGVNLWSSFRVPPPQRNARLYRALVEKGLASSISGAMLPTAEPFLYTLSATATDGVDLDAVQQAMLEAVDEVRRNGVTADELQRAKSQLHARMVFDDDSVTNIAHQLGYFEIIGGVDLFRGLPARLAAATTDEVTAIAAAMLRDANRTIGWFNPVAS
jgi:zinc protease